MKTGDKIKFHWFSMETNRMEVICGTIFSMQHFSIVVKLDYPDMLMTVDKGAVI